MIISDIVDYSNYKIVCTLYFIILIVIFNTNILSYIFKNISDTKINLFNFSILICGSVFLIVYPFVKIKLFNLSVKKKLNKERLYDPLHTIKINKNIENILCKLNELLPIVCIIIYIFMCK